MGDHRLPGRLAAAWRDDRGSMPLAMLIALVGMSLSALLVPIVGQQVTGARFDAQRAQALASAQSGLDAAMAQFRGASDSTGAGLLERLPSCVMTGDASPGGTTTPVRYRVTVEYHNADDVAMSCPPIDVPTTAVLTSTGTGTSTGATTAGAPGTRTITGIYNFTTSNSNILGGLLRLDLNTGPNLCVDVGVTPPKPAVTTWAQVQVCAPGSSRQLFAYTSDLNLKVVGSESTTYPQGMCLEAPVPHTNGQHIVYQPCANRVARQQWVIDDGGNFHGTPNSVSIDGSYCVNMATPTGAGSKLVVGSCSKPFPPLYYPAIGLGAGMAGEDSNQLVNYKQFARCVDVYGGDVNHAFHIAWPCHQAPDGSYAWNQRWYYTHPTKDTPTTVGRVRMVRTSDNAGFCLKSPLSTAAGAYVLMQTCAATGTVPSGMTWTVTGDTGEYASSYRIEDENYTRNGGQHLCLTPTDPDVPNPDLSSGISKLKVAVCDGSALQKWNAPANIERPSPLTDIEEN